MILEGRRRPLKHAWCLLKGVNKVSRTTSVVGGNGMGNGGVKAGLDCCNILEGLGEAWEKFRAPFVHEFPVLGWATDCAQPVQPDHRRLHFCAGLAERRRWAPIRDANMKSRQFFCRHCAQAIMNLRVSMKDGARCICWAAGVLSLEMSLHREVHPPS